MEFLKTVLSEELYNQLTVALNTYNGKPENKEKQIKLANLASGQYVDKGKHDTLTAEKTNLEGQITTLNNTISDLKKNNTDNETLQTTIASTTISTIRVVWRLLFLFEQMHHRRIFPVWLYCFLYPDRFSLFVKIELFQTTGFINQVIRIQDSLLRELLL